MTIIWIFYIFSFKPSCQLRFTHAFISLPTWQFHCYHRRFWCQGYVAKDISCTWDYATDRLKNVMGNLPSFYCQFFYKQIKGGAIDLVVFLWLKLSCDNRFQRAFTVCVWIFKVITLVGSSHGNYFENAIACSKLTLKTTVATQLKWRDLI